MHRVRVSGFYHPQQSGGWTGGEVGSRSLSTEMRKPSRCKWYWDLGFSAPTPPNSKGQSLLPLGCLTGWGRGREGGRVNGEKDVRESVGWVNKWEGTEGDDG